MDRGKPLTPQARQRTRDDVATAEQAPSREEVAQWEGLERTDEFRQLTRARRSFVIPATIFFLAFYFALPLANGLAPGLMKTNVVGHINIAYLFALSQFIMAWVLAWLYIRRANHLIDPLAERVRQRAARGTGSVA